MKSGEILEENTPEAVLERHQCASLEDTFLKICMHQKMYRKTSRTAIATFFNNLSKNQDPQSDRVVRSELKTYRDTNKFSSLYYTVTTLIWRYMIQNFRNPVFLLLFIIFPTGALTTMYLCLGSPPKNIPVAWIVQDLPEYETVHSRPDKYSEAYGKYQIPFYPDLIKSQVKSINF